MCFAVGAEPTNDTASIPGWVRIALTASKSPCTRLNTPGGNPAFTKRAGRSDGESGSRSDGFRMNEFPQTIANGVIHIGIITGKLNGVMPATTPTGCRIRVVSTPLATSSEKYPCIVVGAE